MSTSKQPVGRNQAFFSFRQLLIVALAVALLLVVVPMYRAFAQAPLVPPEFLNRERPVGDDITFCVNSASLLAEFDRELAQVLAAALLVEARFFELRSPYEPYPLDHRLVISEADLYINLNNNCDALLGFVLSSTDHIEWITPTRSYIATGFVFLARGDGVTSIDDLPEGAKVGTVLGTAADARLRTVLSLNRDRYPFRRLPYPDNQLVLERFEDGTLDAVLVWEPAVESFFKSEGGQPEIVAAAEANIPVEPLQFGIGVLTDQAFLRQLLDQAIAEAASAGDIAELLSRYSLGGMVPQ